DRAQVDPVEVEAELAGQHLRGHRLPGAARAGEEGADPEAALPLRREAPPLVHLRAVADVDRELAEELELRRREDEVVPAGCGLNPLREVVEARPRLLPAGVPDRLASGRSVRLGGGSGLDGRRGD